MCIGVVKRIFTSLNTWPTHLFALNVFKLVVIRVIIDVSTTIYVCLVKLWANRFFVQYLRFNPTSGAACLS